MNTPVPAPGETRRRGLHPLVATAAGSVIVLCAIAAAALVGWLPTPWAESSGQQPPLHEAQAQAAEQGQAQPAAPPAPPVPAKVATAPKAAPAPKPAAKPATCADCGVVETIRPVQAPVQNQGNNVVGTVAGGVVGGVVGHQFGGGHGKDALTVLGALGGALAGHEIERNIRQQQTVTHYEMTVRMNDGSTRMFRSAQPFAYASGDHVRVENGQVLPR
ncbi:glycine zipper 2TM domain-containing protein [Bordetella sp. BOR01]|uniref:glycine zipper 2TM domain-containing protein n=1 Tax=Bordetella sp. BOR01 TaxID=2854779 RepID=UPI001C48D72A|nr:glycine zipper 2TM domain-containing protein [Bordetella sp. BOR01]MBV7484923.1 glycine zipper 2TM domain-containing protein [Bordetella sp. BOR01]